MRSPTYEQALKKEGVEWEYLEEVPLEEIDARKGLQNQARLRQPHDSDLSDLYAQAMANGDDFPALVLWRQSQRSRYIPIDGNHRLAGAEKAKRKYFDAYVIKTTDPMVVDRITWSFNLINGKGHDIEDRIQHAVAFVRKYEVTARMAADQFGVKESTLGRALAIANSNDVLNRQNVGRIPPLGEERLHRLQPLLSLGEDVFARGAKLVAESGLSVEATASLVKDTRKAKTHSEKMAVLERHEKSAEAAASRAATKAGTVPVKELPRDKLARAVRALSRLLEDHGDQALKPLNTTFKQAREEARVIVDRLVPLFGLGVFPSSGQEAV